MREFQLDVNGVLADIVDHLRVVVVMGESLPLDDFVGQVAVRTEGAVRHTVEKMFPVKGETERTLAASFVLELLGYALDQPSNAKSFGQAVEAKNVALASTVLTRFLANQRHEEGQRRDHARDYGQRPRWDKRRDPSRAWLLWARLADSDWRAARVGEQGAPLPSSGSTDDELSLDDLGWLRQCGAFLVRDEDDTSEDAQGRKALRDALWAKRSRTARSLSPADHAKRRLRLLAVEAPLQELIENDVRLLAWHEEQRWAELCGPVQSNMPPRRVKPPAGVIAEFLERHGGLVLDRTSADRNGVIWTDVVCPNDWHRSRRSKRQASIDIDGNRMRCMHEECPAFSADSRPYGVVELAEILGDDDFHFGWTEAFEDDFSLASNPADDPGMRDLLEGSRWSKRWPRGNEQVEALEKEVLEELARSNEVSRRRPLPDGLGESA